jgi:hypothetical protein
MARRVVEAAGRLGWRLAGEPPCAAGRQQWAEAFLTNWWALTTARKGYQQ